MKAPPSGPKIIDFSSGRDGRRKDSLAGQMASTFKKKEQASRQAALGALSKVLNRRFTLFQNVVLQEKGVPIPMLVVGPTGIWVINLTFVKGMFRASSDLWEESDGGTLNYRPARSNLLTQTLAMADVVRRYLEMCDLPVEKVDAALLLLDSGAHVETNKPAVRLVVADAVGRFAAGLLQPPIIISDDVVKQIVTALADAIPDDGPVEVRDAYSLREIPAPKKRKPLLAPELVNGLATVGQDEPEFIKKVSRQASFSRKQWIWLGILFLVNFAVLIALVLIILASA